MSPSRRQIVVSVILFILVFYVGVIGFRLTRKPFDLVEISLNKRLIEPDESLTLTINNYGFKRVQFGYDYEIYREYDNGTIEKFRFPDNYAWPAILLGNIAPLIGSRSQRIYSDLEPGNYFVRKIITVEGIGNFPKSTSFTVK